MLFSIIIPAYNAEKYISNCLHSILNQYTDDYEILVIDDGSKDKTKEIVYNIIDEYNNSCIRYIYKENGGVSSARNVGLKAAKGKYIIFLDADDTLTENALKKYNESINKSDVDLYMFSFFYKNNEDIRKSELCNVDDFLIKSDNSINNIGSLVEKTCELIIWYPWGKIYKKDILDKNNLYFDENLICSEDFVFFYTYLMVSHSIQYYNLPIVNYTRDVKCSLTSVKDFKKIISDCNAYEFVFNKIYNINKNAKTILNFISKYYINNVISNDIKTKFEKKIIKQKIKQQKFIFNYNKFFKMRIKRFCLKCLGFKLTYFILK